MMHVLQQPPSANDRRHIHYARNLRIFQKATAGAGERVSQSQLAKDEGISRQRVHQIVRRLLLAKHQPGQIVSAAETTTSHSSVIHQQATP